MRKLVILLVAAFAVLLVPGVAQAAVTFHSGPTFTDNGTTLTVTGNVSGLGNQDLSVFVSATGVGEVTCTNPAGNVAPGQDTTATTSGSQTGIEPKNGRATFDVTTAEPTAPTNACPNRKWTATVTDVDFSSATLTLRQGGRIVFQQTYAL